MAINDINNITQEISGLYCKLLISDYEVIIGNIQSIEISNWVFDLLPRLDITFRDDHLFFNTSTLKPEVSKIELTIGASQEDESKTTWKFLLNNFEFHKIGDVATVSISAYITTKNLSQIKTKAFSNKTSLDVIKGLATDIGLNFKSSPALVTSDVMTWLQRCSNKDFIQYVYNKSKVISDMPLCFADLSGTLNFKSIKKEIDSQLIPTKLEYKTDLFNLKTPAAIEQYKKDHKITGKYGHFYSFQVKNYQQYFDYFISNGVSIVSFDQASGSKKEEKFDGKTYPILTNGKDPIKPDEGKIVNKIFAGIKSKNTHDAFFTAESEKEYNIGSFFSQAFFTEVNYLCDLNLLDVVELNIPDFVDGDQTTMNIPYHGNYLVGGIYMKFDIKKDKILPKKTIIAYRPGANDPVFKIQKQ